MKKKILLLVFAFISLVTLVGCGSNSDDKSLIGSWKYESGDYTYTFNLKTQEVPHFLSGGMNCSQLFYLDL